MEQRPGQGPVEHRPRSIRPLHALAVGAACVVAVLVGFWAISFLAGILWGVVKAVVIVGIVGGLVWLLARRRRA